MQELAPPSPPAGFSAQDFRAALGRFATGVTIITTRGPDGVPVGLTISSFNSVSLAPPLVLWSLALRAGSLAVFRDAGHYAIHVLRAEQRGLAERFAVKDIDRFAGLPDRRGLGEVPLLDGCAATFECRSHSCHEAGDHLIFVGEVLQCQAQTDAAPLIFHGGRFYTELPL